MTLRGDKKMLPNFGEHFALRIVYCFDGNPSILLFDGAQLQGEASARGHEDIDFVGGGYL